MGQHPESFGRRSDHHGNHLRNAAPKCPHVAVSGRAVTLAGDTHCVRYAGTGILRMWT